MENYELNCSITTVLNKTLSREQNTRRDDEDENSGSGKSKNINGISGYGRFFHGKSGSNTPPGGPLYIRDLDPIISRQVKSYKLESYLVVALMYTFLFDACC